MKKNIVILLATIVLISGCVQKAPADLLQIPPLGLEEEALVTAVRQTLPSQSRLSLPYREKGLHAIRKADLDGDGINEAIVTYRNEYDEYKVLLMRQSEGHWSKWMILETDYYQLEWLDVVSLSEENTPELLIGHQAYDSEIQMVDVFRVSDPKLLHPGAVPPDPVASLPYSWADTGDISGDGNMELLIVEHNKKDLTATADFYRIHQESLQKISSIEIDGDVNSYYASEIGKVSKNQNGFLLEASVGAYSSIKYMFVWEEEGKLKQIYPIEGEPYLNAMGTIRSDLNEDGILEIVELLVAPDQDPNTPRIATLFLDKHLQWNGYNHFDTVGLQYTDYQYGFSYLIPEKWGDRFTISNLKSKGTGIITFEFFEAKSGRRAELFTMHAVSYDSWKETELDWQERQVWYKVLHTAAGFVYSAVFHLDPNKLNKDEERMFQKMQLTEEELKKHFIVIDPIE